MPLTTSSSFGNSKGEKWLAFRDDGKYSAADFAKATSEKVSSVLSLQENSWNPFEKEQAFKRRTCFVIRMGLSALKRDLTNLSLNDGSPIVGKRCCLSDSKASRSSLFC
ncbi:hypothetical protein F3Y22_tig00110187pilonHSYRG00105 [Hibiscus syriacus]|uniref:Uncharacterized protein n=1 Tax=Hibiscus syriacus TaxID=106335 RepID=A0A6A3BIG9_HIBSY|nr:hypothetical protein F3Y22_tig00110187pilonHSYRG00105 [Hibiscus syriacus]